MYYFSYLPRIDVLNLDWYCQNYFATCHSAEIPFVFQSLYFYSAYGYSPVDFSMSETMFTYWTSFASSSFANLPTSYTQIPKFNETTEPYIDLNINVTLGANFHDAGCAALHGFITAHSRGEINLYNKFSTTLNKLIQSQ